MSVKVEIYGRNMDVSDRIREYIEKKLEKLDRFMSDIGEARVDLTHIG